MDPRTAVDQLADQLADVWGTRWPALAIAHSVLAEVACGEGELPCISRTCNTLARELEKQMEFE
jgi:hypothetical protein